MVHDLHISLPETLHHHVNARADGGDTYTSADEYIRDLIRKDMEDWQALSGLMKGLKDVQEGNFATESITDIGNDKA